MRPLSNVLAICIVTLSGNLVVSAADWNQWRGPTRDGHTVQESWPSTLKDRIELVWEKPLSPSYSGPVVHGDLVITTETIEKSKERVTAYNLTTGEQAWSTEWPGAMAVPFFAAANGDWIRSTPACSENHLLVLGMRDVLVCLDPRSGQELWRVDFPAQIGTPLPSFGACCSPLIDGETAYLQTGGALVKLAMGDGSVIWKSLENSSGMMSSGAFSSPVIAEICGKRQLVVQTRQELCGVDLETGQTMWRQPIEAFRGMNILTPLVRGDQIFTSAYNGRAQMFRVTHDDASGWAISLDWEQKAQAYMSSPVLINDEIYMHLKNERFTNINANDGETKWTSSPMGKYWSMVSNGQQLLTLSNRGELRLIQPSDNELQIVDTLKVADNSWAHIALNDDLVLVRDLKALKIYRWK